jgi:Carboxypeptidase regulatory-like domain
VKYSSLLLMLVLLSGRPAMAFCNLPQPRLVCAEYFASKVVVEATLVKVKAICDKTDPEYVLANLYSLRAEKVFRGNIAHVFRVYEGNDSGRATFDWEIRRKYLLFLFYVDSEKSWALDGCGNSGPISLARPVLGQIESIQKNHGDGFIHGVVSQRALSDPISGVRVEARGKRGRYATTTDAKGEFDFKVSPGRYVVRAIRPGFVFDTADVSYEDTQNVLIEPGGCAQIQLDARPD